MQFDELSDTEWDLVASLVDDDSEVELFRRGRPRVDPRVVLNAVLWVLSSRKPWAKLPGHYPSIPTCRRRFAIWRENGTLKKLLAILADAGRDIRYVAQAGESKDSAASCAKGYRRRDEVETWDRVIWKSPEMWRVPAPVSAQAEIEPEPQGLPEDDVSPGTPEPCLSVTAGPRDEAAFERLDASRSYQEFDCANGCMVRAGIERIPNGSFRAWSEIFQDGKRVERSGLIGPQFDSAVRAVEHAKAWTSEWLEKHGLKSSMLSDAAGSTKVQPTPKPATLSSGPIKLDIANVLPFSSERQAAQNSEGPRERSSAVSNLYKSVGAAGM